MTLASDLSDLSDLSDKMGGVSVYPVGLLFRSLVWRGRRVADGVMQGAELPQGYARQLDSNGGMQSALA